MCMSLQQRKSKEKSMSLQQIAAQRKFFEQRLKNVFQMSKEEIHAIYKEANLVNEADGQDVELYCVYCLGIIFESVECDQCNTPMCLRCVDEDTGNKGGQWNCPKCQSCTKHKQLNRFLQNQINKIKVNCNRCKGKFTISSLSDQAHLT